MEELCTEMHIIKQKKKKTQRFWDQRPRHQNRINFERAGRQLGEKQKRFSNFFVKNPNNYFNSFQNPSQQRPFNKTGCYYYHAKYENLAFKCEAPCLLQASKDQSVSTNNSCNTV